MPSTAGNIISSSFFGIAILNGDATCITKSHPSIALSQPLSEVKSNILNLRFLIFILFFLKVFMTSFCLEEFLTGPLTLNP